MRAGLGASHTQRKGPRPRSLGLVSKAPHAPRSSALPPGLPAPPRGLPTLRAAGGLSARPGTRGGLSPLWVLRVEPQLPPAAQSLDIVFSSKERALGPRPDGP